MNLGLIITRSARYWADHIAVADSQTRLTYAQLERRSNRLASALGTLGVGVGKHVAILAANRVELVEAEVALYKATMVKVPINARLSVDEVVRVLEGSCTVALITRCALCRSAWAPTSSAAWRQTPCLAASDCSLPELLDRSDQAVWLVVEVWPAEGMHALVELDQQQRHTICARFAHQCLRFGEAGRGLAGQLLLPGKRREQCLRIGRETLLAQEVGSAGRHYLGRRGIKAIHVARCLQGRVQLWLQRLAVPSGQGKRTADRH